MTQGVLHASPPQGPPEGPPGGTPPGRAPGRAPEAKKMRYMREYMPENKAETKCAFKLLPNLEKACIRTPWDFGISFRRNELVKFICNNSVYYRVSSRGVSRKKVDNDGEQRNKKKTKKRQTKGEECKQAPTNVLFSLWRIPRRAETKFTANTEYRKARFNFFSPTANRKRCLTKNKSRPLRRTRKGAFKTKSPAAI